VICPSNDGVTCASPVNVIPGSTLTDCFDQCCADEYIVISGGPPVQLPDGGWTSLPQPDLPQACRFIGANPGGWMYTCCPCGGP
jgi:hypothetical protein